MISGDQYRSLIMYFNDSQRVVAERSRTDYGNRLAVAVFPTSPRRSSPPALLSRARGSPAISGSPSRWLLRAARHRCQSASDRYFRGDLNGDLTALTHTAGREAAEALAELGEDLVPEPVGSGIFRDRGRLEPLGGGACISPRPLTRWRWRCWPPHGARRPPSRNCPRWTGSRMCASWPGRGRALLRPWQP